MATVTLLDSTLRDGAQGEKVSFSLQDKLNIVKALDEFGLDYIEAGAPGSNPKDMEFFHQAACLKLKNAKLCAFGSTRRRDRSVENDEGVATLLDAGTDAVTIVGKAYRTQVIKILNATEEDNLAMIADTVAYLKKHGKYVIFDAEHFFDGYFEDAKFAFSVLSAAVESGAEQLCLCDTNGGRTPTEISHIVKEVCHHFPKANIGIHCHNDCGCAIANAMVAVESGARHIQGTFSGYGERCGNADLSILIPNLIMKKGCVCKVTHLEMLYDTARRVAEISNVSIPGGKPYVGDSAFAHKGGMHVDGMLKLNGAFEHISPEMVGNRRRFLLSEVAGRSTIAEKIRHFAPGVTKDSPEVALIVEQLKKLEYGGYQFEAAEASLELLARKVLGLYKPHFELVQYKTIGEYPAPNGKEQASAMIEVKVGENMEISAALGNGPVNALDLALRRALTVFYPQLDNVHLVDYKVRVLDTDSATAAKVRVLIESTDGQEFWTTVGVSTDIIEASWFALADSIEYRLLKG